ARGEPEMLAAIYAAPDDLSVRDVYADWLIEHGDPRGELIALQRARSAGRSTPKTEQRERALLDEHGVRWAGRLHPLVNGRFRLFEDGFLSGARLNPIDGWRPRVHARATNDDPQTALPEWRLVRDLDVGSADVDVARLLGDLPHLRGLYGLGHEALTVL